MNTWMKKWIPIVSLVVVPIAQAQTTDALRTSSVATADTVRSAAQAKPEEQKLQELQAEVDSIRSELASEQVEQSEVREYLPQDSHPLWP